MSTRVCCPCSSAFCVLEEPTPRSPLTNPPAPHIALPGSSLHHRVRHSADCPSVALPISSWCLPPYGCSLKGESRTRLCPHYPAQNHRAGAQKHPQTVRCPVSSLACLIASLFGRWFLMSLGYSAVTVTTAPAPHSLAFRVSRNSWR